MAGSGPSDPTRYANISSAYQRQFDFHLLAYEENPASGVNRIATKYLPEPLSGGTGAALAVGSRVVIGAGPTTVTRRVLSHAYATPRAGAFGAYSPMRHAPLAVWHEFTSTFTSANDVWVPSTTLTGRAAGGDHANRRKTKTRPSPVPTCSCPPPPPTTRSSSAPPIGIPLTRVATRNAPECGSYLHWPAR